MLRDAALDNNSEVVTPSPDVTAAEWEACKEELQGLQEEQLRAKSSVLKNWLRWLRKVVEVREAKAGLAAKRAASKQAKEQLSAIHASLDAAGRDSPFSLALMHSVAQATREQGAPLSREQLLWVLARAKGDERVAISLAVSQASARRALPVLRQPKMLRAFDVTQVTGAMVHKVKQTLRLPALKPLIAALDQADEAGGGGARRDPGQRPQVGDTVVVVRATDESCLRFIGSAGILEEDDESDNPFYVRATY